MGLAKSFSPWYWLYVALEFLEAAFGDSYLPTYILSEKFVMILYPFDTVIPLQILILSISNTMNPVCGNIFAIRTTVRWSGLNYVQYVSPCFDVSL